MDERLRLDPDVIARGLAHTRRIREQLQAHTTPPTTDVDEVVVDGEPVGEVGRFDPDRIAAEMAAADERDRLRARVALLEQENMTLRRALGEVLRVIGAALDDPDPTDNP